MSHWPVIGLVSLEPSKIAVGFASPIEVSIPLAAVFPANSVFVAAKEGTVSCYVKEYLSIFLNHVKLRNSKLQKFLSKE